MRLRVIAVTMIMMMSCSPAYAFQCVPKFVPEAEFGPRDLETQAKCPGIPADVEQSCEVVDGGVTYGLSRGLIVHKEAERGKYSGKMPFGLVWGELLEFAIRKTTSVTRDDPVVSVSMREGAYVLDTVDYCLKTASASADYSLVLWIDRERGLYKIEGRILYP